MGEVRVRRYSNCHCGFVFWENFFGSTFGFSFCARIHAMRFGMGNARDAFVFERATKTGNPG